MYYQGDYYQGDYYQGDPFFGALIGGAVSWLGKKLLGKSAGQVGQTAIARVGAGATTGLIAGSVGTAMIPAARSVLRRIPKLAMPLPGGGVFRPGAALPGGMPMTSPGCCPSGFHMNKSTTSRGAPAGTVCVRNRSMNVANPRALRRSLRRVAGFGKLAMRAKKDIRRAAKSIGA